jgi:hypothetical protein
VYFEREQDNLFALLALAAAAIMPGTEKKA